MVYTLTFIFFLPKNGGNRACSIDEAFPSGMSMHTRASQHRCAFVLLPRSHAAAAGLVLSMLALQAANNETGAIHPVREAAALRG